MFKQNRIGFMSLFKILKQGAGMYVKIFFSSMMLFMLNVNAEIIISDSGIDVSKEEIVQAAKYWPEKLRQEAITDTSARYILLSQFIQNKKIANRVKEITEEIDPEFYWQREFAIRNLQNKMYLKHYMDKLIVPDMVELAEEKYLVNKGKYGVIPEERQASHILIGCAAGACDREIKRPDAEKLLKELRAGANFEKMVEKYSDDPGSKMRKGQLKQWVRAAGSRLDGYFTEGVFSIKAIGQYSDLVETRFGFHIIRLDKIKEKSLKPKEEVFPQLIKELENKYKKLSKLNLISQLVLSDKASIKDEEIDKILVKYKKKPKEKLKPGESNKLIIKKITRP